MFEELGRNIDNLFRSIQQSVSVTQIDPRTDPVAIDYPSDEPVGLRLELGVGTLKVAPGGDKLVEGAITYNVQEWSPQVQVEGGNVTLKQEHTWPISARWNELQNDWVLNLGTARPYELSVMKGVAQGKFALDALPLTALSMDIGAGETQVDIRQPNPQTMDRAMFRTGTGNLEIVGLLNLNAKRVSVDSGTGQLYLSFTGDSLQQDMRVNINVGTGSVIVSVQRNIPARVSLSQGLGGVTPRGDFKAVAHNLFEAAGYSSAGGPKISFEIQSGMGGVTLTTLNEGDATTILGR